MFWRSVVGKLWVTILMLVCFVLFILTVLLLQFFENYHLVEAEDELVQSAKKVTEIVEEYDNRELALDIIDHVVDSSTRVLVLFEEEDAWLSSEQGNSNVPPIDASWVKNNEALARVMEGEEVIKQETSIPKTDTNILIVGTPIEQGSAVYMYQDLTFVEQTSAQTTKIIFLGAGIAVILTTIFAFFLSTRITSPLIKMREGAFELARGEFNTKVPILTHDEIGELAMAFNRMGRQLKFHINALSQEKEQLSGILRSMADGVITLNRNGEVLITNPPAAQFLHAWEYETGKVMLPNEAYLPEPLQQLLDQVVTAEEEGMAEYTIQGRSWVVIMTPLYNQSYVRGAVAVIRDMTEERRLDKLRKDFIANVSHELRTPISMLQGYSEAIVDDVAESKEEKNELAQIIHEESLRIGRLVNELLDLARMEAGHIQLNLEQVHMQPFIERIVKKFHGLAGERGVTLNLSLADSASRTSCMDPDRFEQVLTNLIDNAIRHSYENGVVKVNAFVDQKQVVIAVQDEGSGIEEEDLPFVFERFYKADKSRKREKGKSGTGLGLAIAKNIMEAHQGTISVHSKIGEGTTFTCKLPLQDEC
ncbi:sensor histidine kinase [Pontibacillus halophilus JSM 076056 = DSM 19796]|uniref:histidine kinase n=1 Tax=Pontibacillus halophilus JSM 076056 = DSM 19796 TaxID=1385510 RepID=A0A0A5I8N7_9BACI|nr:ATP-binding protein [Pontibacillus halophilus]KGX92202.1 sensor histidine kinase [Pontibacillus halophilus JSM 076056 = DSM 19796]